MKKKHPSKKKATPKNKLVSMKKRAKNQAEDILTSIEISFESSPEQGAQEDADKNKRARIAAGFLSALTRVLAKQSDGTIVPALCLGMDDFQKRCDIIARYSVFAEGVSYPAILLDAIPFHEYVFEQAAQRLATDGILAIFRRFASGLSEKALAAIHELESSGYQFQGIIFWDDSAGEGCIYLFRNNGETSPAATYFVEKLSCNFFEIGNSDAFDDDKCQNCFEKILKKLFQKKYRQLIDRAVDPFQKILISFRAIETGQKHLDEQRAARDLRARNRCVRMTFRDILKDIHVIKPEVQRINTFASGNSIIPYHDFFRMEKDPITDRPSSLFLSGIAYMGRTESYTWQGTEVESENVPEYLSDFFTDLKGLATHISMDSNMKLSDLHLSEVPWMNELRQALEEKTKTQPRAVSFQDIADEYICAPDEIYYGTNNANALEDMLTTAEVWPYDAYGERHDNRLLLKSAPVITGNALEDLWIDLAGRNCIKLIFDTTKVNLDYFLLYYHADDDRRPGLWFAPENPSPFFPSEMPKPLFPSHAAFLRRVLDCDIFLPPIDIQNQVVTEYKIAQASEKHATNIIKAIKGWKEFPASSNMVLDFASIRLLPQPLASALYIAQCEATPVKQNRELVNFLEASAQFVATAFLSIVYKYKRHAFENLIKGTRRSCNDIAGQRQYEYAFTFGSWSWYVKNAISKAKILLKEHGISNNQARHDVLSLILRGESLRNEAAHGGRTPQNAEKEAFLNVITPAIEMSERLVELFQDIDFVYIEPPLSYSPVAQEIGATAFMITARNMRGPMPRLCPIKCAVTNPDEIIDRPAIYLYLRRTKELIRMLPYIHYGALAERDKELLSACYISKIIAVADATDDTHVQPSAWTVEWKSYDCGDTYRVAPTSGDTRADTNSGFLDSASQKDGRELYAFYQESLSLAEKKARTSKQ